MEIIKNFKDLVKSSQLENFNEELKIILVDCYLIERNFGSNSESKIIILQENEEFETDLIPELELKVGCLNKKLYLLDDFGNGIITYQKNKGENNE